MDAIGKVTQHIITCMRVLHVHSRIISRDSKSQNTLKEGQKKPRNDEDVEKEASVDDSMVVDFPKKKRFNFFRFKTTDYWARSRSLCSVQMLPVC